MFTAERILGLICIKKGHITTDILTEEAHKG
jgi:hypothetical protein